tara:strand:+ start:270 stop:884 length:615 start_codon:yes stop_codon:yes gene_type:complete
MIGVLDYGCGNVLAIRNVYKRLNIQTEEICKPSDFKDSIDKIILPGVGAFDEVVIKLNESGLLEKLNEKVLVHKLPVLGICVGMQIMASESEEGKLAGLNWIPGQVKKFDNDIDSFPRTPHMGWNEIKAVNEQEIFKGVDQNKGFYFLHSYYFEASNNSTIIATTNYSKSFSSAINFENIYGVQFHPEKSHTNGIRVFKNFSEI